MIKVENYDSWTIWDGASEGGGRSEKEWLQSKEGVIGLFKYPKSIYTTEYVSEHLAYKIGQTLNIQTAKVEIGTRNGRIGCMSYLINKEDESIIEGVSFITGFHPNYNLDTLYDSDNKKYYCIDYVLEFFETIPSIKYRLIEMMIFDFLIGNTDRHHSNWAMIIKYEDSSKTHGKMGFCPLYDNGSSLCCYETEEKALDIIHSKDFNRINALTNTKSRSIIRLDGSNKARPTHKMVLEYLIDKYDCSREICNRIVEIMDSDTINRLVNDYPDDILQNGKKKMIIEFLNRKMDILREVLYAK